MVEKVGKLFIVFIFLPFIVYANPAVRDGLPIISKINYINNQLNNITVAIGKKKPESSRFRLKNTSKRELYYTLLALYDKVNRFNFEVTGIYILPPKNIDEVKDEDISSLLDKIIGMIGQSSDNLKISKKPFEVSHSISRFDIDKSFNNVIYANIQIENILYQKTSPREVYKDVSQANKNILSILPQSKIKKPVEEKIAYKSPSDVYEILLKCYAQLSIYANIKHYNIATMDISGKNILSKNIQPSDVLNLAKLIFSETIYLKPSRDQSNSVTLHESYKTPTDVYKQALLLLSNLRELNEITAKKQVGQV